MARAREEVMFTLRVAVFLQAGIPRSEIARRLGVKHVQVLRAVERLAAIAGEIERD